MGEEQSRGENELEKDRGALGGMRRSLGSLKGGLVSLVRNDGANCCSCITCRCFFKAHVHECKVMV